MSGEPADQRLLHPERGVLEQDVARAKDGEAVGAEQLVQPAADVDGLHHPRFSSRLVRRRVATAPGTEEVTTTDSGSPTRADTNEVSTRG